MSPRDLEPWPTFLAAMTHIAVHSFGGPVAQIAVVHEEVVEKRKWIDDPTFSRLLSFANVLPGPEALELIIHIGYLRRGIAGGMVAGLLFIAPGIASLTLLAWLYAQYGSTHLLAVLQAAIRPVGLGLVVAAALRLSRKLLGTPRGYAITAGMLVASYFLGVPFWVLLVAGAVSALLLPAGVKLDERRRALIAGGLIVVALAVGVATFRPGPPVEAGGPSRAALVATLPEIARLNLGTALVTFGGAYTALPYLRHQVVDENGWLSDGAMLDAIALGETTPGPLISIAVFVSYLIGGFSGAMVGAFFLFLPSFVFVLTLGKWVDTITSLPRVARALEGVVATTIGLILALTIDLVGNVRAIAGAVIAAGTFIAVTFFRVSPAVVVAAVTAVMVLVDLVL